MMIIEYQGGMKFDAYVRGHKIIADQPEDQKGNNQGPTPAELFVASVGTCIGVYALSYCQKHKIPYEKMKIKLRWEKAFSPARISYIEVEILLPHGCPEEHKKPLLDQAKKCFVHNTITQQPPLPVNIKIVD